MNMLMRSAILINFCLAFTHTLKTGFDIFFFRPRFQMQIIYAKSTTTATTKTSKKNEFVESQSKSTKLFDFE